MNDELDDTCVRCAAGRDMSAPEAAPLPAEPAMEAPTVPIGPASAAPRGGGLEKLAVAIIAVSVLGLLGVGYLAYTRGIFGSKSAKVKVTPVTVTDDPAGATPEVEDSLAAIENSSSPALRPYRPSVEILREADRTLTATQVTTAAPGVLSEQTKQQLYALADLGQRLIGEYGTFEKEAADGARKELEETEMLRRAYIERMVRIVEKIGDSYRIDDELNHPAYLLSDSLAGAIDQAGVGDAQPVRDRWLEIVHGRDQRILDDSHVEDYRRIQAHIDTMTQVHDEFAALLASIPAYKIRGGYIGKDATRALETYDALADKVEAIVVEFDKLMEAFPEQERPDQMKQLVAHFNTKAQEDHFFAFRETYLIYAQDRELRHPAYDKLKAHYEFVEAHWPSNAAAYEETYLKYEELWAQAWAGN